MESNSRRVAALGLMWVLVVLALAADANAQSCNLGALFPCYNTVQGPYPPRPNAQCCNAVRVVNPSCLCRQFMQGSYPPNMIRNAFAMPKACGRTNLRGYRCGRYVVE